MPGNNPSPLGWTSGRLRSFSATAGEISPPGSMDERQPVLVCVRIKILPRLMSSTTSEASAGNIALAMLPTFSEGKPVPLSEQLQALIENAIGGSGDDVFVGNQGNNVFTGNAGADQFLFNLSPSPSNIDTITDFDPVVDIIDLDDAAFANLGSVGVLTAEA